MIAKSAISCLIILAVAWIAVASPEIFDKPGSIIVAAFVVTLGAVWICIVPGAYFAALRYGQKINDMRTLKAANLVVASALIGGFIVSYGVLAGCVGIGALTVFRQGGMYESSLLWVFAPFIAGKYSIIGLLAGSLAGIMVSRRAGV